MTVKNGYRQVELFDMENVKEKEALNDLLRSKNVRDYEHHVLSTPMGGCKVLLFYHIFNPEQLASPPDRRPGKDGNT